MDIGMQVKCHRCTQEFQMYRDTHGVGDNLAGMCPLCNAMVTAKVYDNDNILIYNPTSGEVGKGQLDYHAGEENANDIQP